MKEMVDNIFKSKIFAHPFTISYLLSFILENIDKISIFIFIAHKSPYVAVNNLSGANFAVVFEYSFWFIYCSQTFGKYISTVIQAILNKFAKKTVSIINNWNRLKTSKEIIFDKKNTIEKLTSQIKKLEEDKKNRLNKLLALLQKVIK
jgi:hypothetical protein